MKNFGWFLITLFLLSCKKDYDCECITKDSAGNVIGTSTYQIQATKMKAKSECDKHAENSLAGSSTSKSCSIK